MKNTKPAFEKIIPEFGTSMRVKQHNQIVENKLPFWHFHPELELVYINKANGKRHIGSHLSYFDNSQLILIGASLPHSGFTDRFTTNGSETIVQFRDDFLGTEIYLTGRVNRNQLFNNLEIVANAVEKVDVEKLIETLNKN